MASGSLMHLVSINPETNTVPMLMETADIRAPNPETFDVSHIEFNNNLLTIPRNNDLVSPKYLLLDLPANQANNQARVEYIDNLINNYELIMEANQQNILSIPFLIMNNLEPYSITPNNKLRLTIPFEKVFSFPNGIPQINLGFTMITCKLNNYTNQQNQLNHQIINGKIISIGKYLDTPIRRQIAQNQHEAITKQIHKNHYTSTTPNSTFNINGGGYLNGVILQLTSPNVTIANIRKVAFLLNGHPRLEWDADMLDLMAVRLSDKALYINPNMDGNGLLAQINTNTLNLSRFDTFQIKMETNLADGFTTTMHFIVNNKVNIRSGMIGFQFHIDFSNTPLIREPRDFPPGQQHPTTSNLPIPIIGIQWICEPITFDIPTDTICPITHDTLNPEEGIYKCITCNNLIDFNAFKTWIAGNRSCPLCRTRDISNIYYGIH